MGCHPLEVAGWQGVEQILMRAGAAGEANRDLPILKARTVPFFEAKARSGGEHLNNLDQSAVLHKGRCAAFGWLPLTARENRPSSVRDRTDDIGNLE
jgi:hypothetical protein